MMRTIDADAFDATMYEAWMNCEITNEEWFHVREMIKDEPTVEPQKRRGRWHQRIYQKVEMMVCSECGNEFSYDAETGVRDYNFCPNCGADMRGGQDVNH